MAKSEHDPESFPALAGRHAPGGGRRGQFPGAFQADLRVFRVHKKGRKSEGGFRLVGRWAVASAAWKGEWWRWLSLQPENLARFISLLTILWQGGCLSDAPRLWSAAILRRFGTVSRTRRGCFRVEDWRGNNGGSMPESGVKRRRIAALQSGTAAKKRHVETVNYFQAFLKHAENLSPKTRNRQRAA